jgi:hypothetical protein
VAAVKAAQKRIPNNGDDLPLSVVWQWCQHKVGMKLLRDAIASPNARQNLRLPGRGSRCSIIGPWQHLSDCPLLSALRADQVCCHPLHTSLWWLLRRSRTPARRTFHCRRQLVEVSIRSPQLFLQCNTHPMLEIWRCTPQHQETKHVSCLSSSMYRTHMFRGCRPCWLEIPSVLHVPPATFCTLYQNA